MEVHTSPPSTNRQESLTWKNRQAAALIPHSPSPTQTVGTGLPQQNRVKKTLNIGVPSHLIRLQPACHRQSSKSQACYAAVQRELSAGAAALRNCFKQPSLATRVPARPPHKNCCFRRQNSSFWLISDSREKSTERKKKKYIFLTQIKIFFLRLY